MRAHVAVVRPDLENLMPRVVFRLAAVFVLIASAAEAQQASRLETIIQRGTLRIGMTGDYLPFTFFDKATSTFKGFDVDVAKPWAKRSVSRSSMSARHGRNYRRISTPIA